ncbi:thiamine phosphate synthase [Stackebrandtia nassauensis]|uniref:Thiamine monophosphate synthase n=1 Tax=Stackebrandtia nassauensis (strain DSM 44728 / CIP 108903 / NRRL B-16338 / NBRC 102104 / LLR-40K-21) TaxID=446470 RepID=D3QC03_STANL|nr:thiamine phosphate synthase [Stackebrandtia nassauensis]ADD44892.1 thiamine monophosphate synthase [Stackebrandtia nassauensis DSM 44728]
MIHTLPRLLILTDASACPRPLPEQIALALDAGARAFVLREKGLPPARRRALAQRLEPPLTEAGAKLIISDPTWTVDACHLSALARAPRPRPDLVGRSAHTGQSDDPNADYVTFSPIYPTASKPGYGPALGPEGLAEYCASSRVPVYALGGVETGERAAECRAAGAHGVAVMGAVMRAEDPATVVRELLDGLD